MTPGRWLSHGAAKEARALFPVWLFCTVAVCAPAILPDVMIITVSVLAFAVGAMTLGALSIGHEYTCRTLGLLLSQPADRRHLLLVKQSVSAAMVLTLSATAWYILLGNGPPGPVWIARQPLVLLAVTLSGLFVAPWLTMLTRSPLAGVVLALATPLALLVLGDLLGVARYGDGGGAPVDALKLAVLQWGMAAVCVVAAVSGWRRFMRLEATEGGEVAVSLPQLFPEPRRPRTGHPILLLINKELHLQHMTLAVVLLFVAGWAVVSVLPLVVPRFRAVPLGPLPMLYLMVLPIIIGSVASAEDRQLRTLEWQTLLPMAAWQQWAIKVGVALGLALLLAVGVPALIGLVSWSSPEVRHALGLWKDLLLIVVVLTTSGLYVSSLCSSGLRALLLSFPIGLGVLVYLKIVGWLVYRVLSPFVRTAGRPAPRHVEDWVMALLIAGFVGLLTRLAYVNHRSMDRSVGRVSWQAACVAAYLGCGVALLLLMV
jgi:ABC-type transport system involved in multi-copper enzyme maturation permease subunit